MDELNSQEIQQWKEHIEKHMEELFSGVEQFKSDLSKFDSEFFAWKQRMNKSV